MADRVVEVRAPSGDSSGPRVTQKAYNGLVTIETDANGHTIEKRKGPTGNLQQSTDDLGNSNYYTYDGFDNLLEVEDAQGNITSMEYDDRNRKVFMYDYDNGWIGALDRVDGPDGFRRRQF